MGPQGSQRLGVGIEAAGRPVGILDADVVRTALPGIPGSRPRWCRRWGSRVSAEGLAHVRLAVRHAHEREVGVALVVERHPREVAAVGGVGRGRGDGDLTLRANLAPSRRRCPGWRGQTWRGRGGEWIERREVAHGPSPCNRRAASESPADARAAPANRLRSKTSRVSREDTRETRPRLPAVFRSRDQRPGLPRRPLARLPAGNLPSRSALHDAEHAVGAALPLLGQRSIQRFGGAFRQARLHVGEEGREPVRALLEQLQVARPQPAAPHGPALVPSPRGRGSGRGGCRRCRVCRLAVAGIGRIAARTRSGSWNPCRRSSREARRLVGGELFERRVEEPLRGPVREATRGGRAGPRARSRGSARGLRGPRARGARRAPGRASCSGAGRGPPSARATPAARRRRRSARPEWDPAPRAAAGGGRRAAARPRGGRGGRGVPTRTLRRARMSSLMSLTGRLVAAMTRRSVLRVVASPRRWYSPSSITRSRWACRLGGSSANSSRKSVDPSASPTRPGRSGMPGLG